MGHPVNIPIIFTLYISSRLHGTYCFIQVGCHVTIHVPSISSKLQHQRVATRDPVWPQIEVRIMACLRRPVQAIRSWFAVAKFLPYLPFLHKSDNWVSNIFICPAPVLPLWPVAAVRTRAWNEGYPKVRENFIVSYSRPSFMIIMSASKFHVYLPWGQRPFSIVS